MKTNGLYPTCSLSQSSELLECLSESHTSYLWPWQNQDAWETAPPPPLSEQAAPCILQYQRSQCWVSVYNFALHGSHPSTHCENVSIVYWVADIQEIRLEAEHRPLPYLTPGQLCIATTWGCSWPPCHPDPLITNRAIQHNNTDALLTLLPFHQDCVHSEHLQLVHPSKRESHHRIVIIYSVLHWADG